MSESVGKSGRILQVLSVLSPVLVVVVGAVLGFHFNNQLEAAKQTFAIQEMELKRIDAAQRMLTELFSQTPERAFAAERLLSRVITDESLRREIQDIVRRYYKAKFKITGEDISTLAQIAEAAENVGSEAGKLVLGDTAALVKSQVYVVIGSYRTQEAAVRLAKRLERNGLQPEVHRTPSEKFPVALPAATLAEGARLRTEAIRSGMADESSWVTQGKTWKGKIYP